jgi:hypothetical protein
MKLARSVQISGYGLDDQQIVVRFPAKVSDLPLLQIVQTGCGTHPTSYAGDPALFLREEP